MRLVLLLTAVWSTAPLAAQQPSARPTAVQQRSVQFSGLVLVNGFFTNARVNNSDVPQLAEADTAGVAGSGGTIRQTRLGVLVTDPNVLGGVFSGEVDTDFFGGQQPSSGGRTFPLLRLRRAVGTLQWGHTQLLFGQESPLVAERSPRSLASVGFPDFAGAGNLWLWLPQGRVTVELGYTLRLALQGAVLAPASGTAQPPFATQPDSAERSKRPSLQGRLRLGWGPTDDPSEIAVGGHVGWIRSDSVGGDSLIVSNALTMDARVKFGFLELIGEVYTGQGLAGLGSGGIGQNVGMGGEALRTQGGWGQINFRPMRQVMFGAGCGIDDPDDRDVPLVGRLQNIACEGHLEWRPTGPLVFGFEFRRLSTRYRGGDARASHLNLAAGYRF
ncbi:MAG: hypothetical protein ACREMF_05040 [Gemmatimonadales bacterium]